MKLPVADAATVRRYAARLPRVHGSELSRLAVLVIKAGVLPERIEPGKPQQNGRLERLHLTLLNDTASPPALTLRQQLADLIDDLPGPFGAFTVGALVDADATALAELHAQVVPDADDQLVVAVAIEVGTPDAVAPLELFVDHVAVPEFPLGVRR